MWDRDIGALPVVDGTGKVVGMITDRDIAMAAYIKGKPLSAIPVRKVMSSDVVAVSSAEPLHRASSLMRRHQLRRLPVVDDQGVVSGMLTMSDLARRTGGRRAAKPGLLVPDRAVAGGDRRLQCPSARRAEGRGVPVGCLV